MTREESSAITALLRNIEHLAGVQTAHGQRLDRLVQLSEAREAHIGEVAKRVEDIDRKVTEMAPAVQVVTDTMTFAKVGKRFVAGAAMIGATVATVVSWVGGNLDWLKKVLLIR